MHVFAPPAIVLTESESESDSFFLRRLVPFDLSLFFRLPILGYLESFDGCRSYACTGEKVCAEMTLSMNIFSALISTARVLHIRTSAICYRYVAVTRLLAPP